eukprot:3941116-Rhodomonas_salina.2
MALGRRRDGEKVFVKREGSGWVCMRRYGGVQMFVLIAGSVCGRSGTRCADGGTERRGRVRRPGLTSTETGFDQVEMRPAWVVTLEFEHQPPFRVQGGFMEGAGGSRNQTQAVQIYPEIKHKQYKYTPKSGASSTSTPRNQTRAVQMHHEIKRKQYTYTPKSYARNENYCTIRSRFESSYLRRRSAEIAADALSMVLCCRYALSGTDAGYAALHCLVYAGMA